MSAFLPLLDKAGDRALFNALDRLGPIITYPQNSLQIPDHAFYLVDQQTSITAAQVADWLDAGVEKVILPLSQVAEIINVIPAERLILFLDAGSISAVSDRIRGGVSGVVLKTPAVDSDLISSRPAFSLVPQFIFSSTLLSPLQFKPFAPFQVLVQHSLFPFPI